MSFEKHLSEQSAEWYSKASPEDIATAIEYGHLLVPKIKEQKPRAVHALPVVKGQQGEKHVEDIITREFGNVANVSKTSMRGDLTLYISHRKITVEVKNYNNPVPTISVDKFRRDLNTTNSCGGVFISLNSPIANITGNFSIIYERTDTKTIPCAYIVSSDENAIIIAINMISQLINSVDFVAKEVLARDIITTNVYDLAEYLDDVSRVRNDLLTGISEITNSLVKTSVGLVGAESNIRRVIDNMRGELCNMVVLDEPILPGLASHAPFNKQPAEIQGYISGVVKTVQDRAHRENINGVIWKISAKKCISHYASVIFYAAKTEITIPRTGILMDVILKMFNIFGKKITMCSTDITVELCSQTYDSICALISGNALSE